jgi:hypothetical protein
MVLLISSRLIFTFSDVSDVGKNAIAVVLIIFLILVLIRTVGKLILRKLRGNDTILVTRGMIESLESADRSSINEAVTNHQIFHRQRVVEIDRAYAMSCSASDLFVGSGVQPTNSSQAPAGIVRHRVRVVSTAIQMTDTAEDIQPTVITTNNTKGE